MRLAEELLGIVKRSRAVYASLPGCFGKASHLFTRPAKLIGRGYRLKPRLTHCVTIDSNSGARSSQTQ